MLLLDLGLLCVRVLLIHLQHLLLVRFDVLLVLLLDPGLLRVDVGLMLRLQLLADLRLLFFGGRRRLLRTRDRHGAEAERQEQGGGAEAGNSFHEEILLVYGLGGLERSKPSISNPSRVV